MTSLFSGLTKYFSKSEPYPTLTDICSTLEKSKEKTNTEFEELKADVDTKKVDNVVRLKNKYDSVCNELKELLEEGKLKRSQQTSPPTSSPQSGGRKKTIKRRNSKSKTKSKRKHY